MKCSLNPAFFRPFIALSVLAVGAGSASAQSTFTTPYSIVTFAGSGTAAFNDGQGTYASFGNPQGIAVDGSGNVYVADTGNDMIRAIPPNSGADVGNFAGQPGLSGDVNGAASTVATFNSPSGVAVDSAGNVYVADTNNQEIRKIAAGASGETVTTFAGTGVLGHADGPGASATFGNPIGIAVDSAGNVYVADEGNNTIREITPAGVVSTIAGTGQTPHIVGHADGVGASASFNQPEGVAVDSAGNLYVADSGNSTIRKITPSGSGASKTWTVSTLAGTAGVIGSADLTGSAAQFYYPLGVAVDSAGYVYVADTYNETIRKITPAGVVSTLAGTVGTIGSQDGTGPSAQFYQPYGVAVDSTGNLYVADTYNSDIRLGTSATANAPTIAPSGEPQSQTVPTGAGVTFTVTASPAASVSYQWKLNNVAITGATSSSYFISSAPITDNGNVYTVVVSDSAGSITSSSATLTVINVTQPTVSNPSNQTVNAGSTATFTTTATGGDLTYQWYLNGVSIPGTNNPTLTLANVGTSQTGYYVVQVSNPAGSAFSTGALLTVNYSARLDNLSARAYVGTSGNILIAGFNIGGTGTKNLLLRGVGPTLSGAPYSVPGALSTPQLTLYDTSAAPGPYPIVTNIGWGNPFTLGISSVQVSPQAATSIFMNSVDAFPLNSGSADCALEVTPPTGGYTSQITGVGSTSGVALAEIYDADTGTPTARLTNISARAAVGVGGNIAIGGFEITGTTSETVLIRGVGPGLTSVGVPSGFLAQPQLTLFDTIGSGNVIAANSGWSTSPTIGPSTVQAGVQPATPTVMNSVGAFPLTTGSADAAMVVTLPPGGYTAQVSGVGGTTGITLVEVYEVP
jgi:sugar lactone lactonase YvrE